MTTNYIDIMERNDSEFFLVGCYQSLHEAVVINTLLGAKGINTQIIDQGMSDIYPIFNSNLMVRVIANSSDKEKIETILNSKVDLEDFKEESE